MRTSILTLVLLTAACPPVSNAKPKSPPSKAPPKGEKLAKISTAPRTQVERENAKSPLGMNLVQNNFVSTEWAFIDSMKTASWWTSGTADKWDDGRRIAKDSEGWPTKLEPGQRATTIMSAQQGGPMVLTYAGRGAVEIAGTEKGLQNVVTKKNRIRFTAERDQRLTVAITKTDPKAPVRDLQIYPLKYEERVKAGAVLNPLFLERLAPFSVVRFMDWQIVNGTKIRSWKHRSDPRFYTQTTGTGVAYEYMILVANTLKAAPWICLPHEADDDFVEKLAMLLRAELDPSLKIYVEYSNEVWHDHPSFTQAAYAMKQGLEAKLATKPDVARLRFQAKRSTEMMKIFERVLGTERLVRVLGSQLGNHYAHAELISNPDTKKHHDAIAIGAYFGHELQGLEAMLKKDDAEAVFDVIEAKSIPWAIEAIRLSTKWGKANGMKVLAYEGGPGLLAHPGLEENQQVQSLLDRVNDDPRMKKLYRRMLDGWKAAGGELFVHFVLAAPPMRFGRFGALNFTGQSIDEAPRYDAMIEFIEKNPRWW